MAMPYVIKYLVYFIYFKINNNYSNVDKVTFVNKGL